MPLRFFKIAILLLLLACSVYGLQWSKNTLRQQASDRQALLGDQPPLYLPEAKYIKLITLGFDSFASDILWFNTLNYFGKQFHAKRDYRWLNHMCNLVTALDSNPSYAFEFCGTMLSWSAKEPEKSNLLLERAIEAHPNAWRYRYLRGFNYWYFLEQRDKARLELEIAAKLPDAPAFLATLASRLMASDQDPKVAIEFLRDMIQRTTDKSARNTLIEKLNLAYVSLHISFLEQGVKTFESRFGYRPESLQDLVSSGIISALPTDPFGGKYYIEQDSQMIKTTSGKKGLTFSGKTLKTGDMGSVE